MNIQTNDYYKKKRVTVHLGLYCSCVGCGLTGRVTARNSTVKSVLRGQKRLGLQTIVKKQYVHLGQMCCATLGLIFSNHKHTQSYYCSDNFSFFQTQMIYFVVMISNNIKLTSLQDFFIFCGDEFELPLDTVQYFLPARNGFT